MSIDVKSRKGSLFVESAIVLPFFLLAVISISLLIKVAGIEENTMRLFASESETYSKDMYLSQFDGSFLPDVGLEYRTLKKIDDEVEASLEDVQVKRNCCSYYGDEAVVDFSLLYEIDMPLAIPFKRSLKHEQRLIFRGFVGADKEYSSFGFDRMEETDDSSMVCIFPRAGERFHSKDCRLIDIYPVELVLSPVIKNKYDPCRLCKAGDLPWGCLVYCFDKSGKVYHRGDCAVVDRYVVEIHRKEAIKRGYTPCYYCGGGS
jgi:hypothetical protein